MSFDNVFGMAPQIRSLQRALQHDQLAGCYLFAGPAGVGKTTLALALAKAAACLEPSTAPFDACGKCSSCLVFEAGTHPEIITISPAGDTTQIWQFWDRPSKPNGVLQHSLSFAPTVGRKRVYIIERADTLTESAANSILKSLEEPPSYGLFILLTPHTTRLLPTILSRSQVLRIPPSPTVDLAEYLTTIKGISPDRAKTAASYSEGRIGAAIRMAGNPDITAELDRMVEAVVRLAESKPLGALRAAELFRKTAGSLKALLDTDAPTKENERVKDKEKDTIASDAEGESTPKERVGKKSLAVALDVAAIVFRDILSVSLTGNGAHIIHGGQVEILSKAASKKIPEEWHQAVGATLTARKRIDQNVPGPLVTDWLAMRVAS